MALASLKPTTRVISILIATVEHNTVYDTLSVRSDAPEIEETVFSTENTGGDQSTGTERLTIGLGGPLFAGAAEANPLLPLASWQNKAFVFTFSTSQIISGTMNVISSGPDIRAGGAARTSATARSKGAITVTWPST